MPDPYIPDFDDMELKDMEIDLPNFHIPFYIKVNHLGLDLNFYNIQVGNEQRIFQKKKNTETYLFSIVDEQVMVNENLGKYSKSLNEAFLVTLALIKEGIKMYDKSYLDKYSDIKKKGIKMVNEKLGLPSFTFDSMEDYDTLMTRELDSYMLKSQYMPFDIFSVERPTKYRVNEGYIECPRIERITRLPDDVNEIQNILVDYGVIDLFEDISYQKYKKGVLVATEPEVLGTGSFTIVLLDERFSNGILRPSLRIERDQEIINDISNFCKRFTDALSMGRREHTAKTPARKTVKSVTVKEEVAEEKEDPKDEVKKSIIYLKEYTKAKKTKYSRGTSRSKSQNKNEFHLVRGHMRYYKSGKVVFIKSYKRGNAKTEGQRTSRHEYVIKF